MDKIPRVPQWAGNYPFPPNEKRPTLLTEWRMPRLYGIPPHQVETCLLVSTDRITSSGFQLRSGQWFEPADIHGGTEVYYVLSGEATAMDPETGRTHVVVSGSVLYIPKQMWHQTYNFAKEDLNIITFFAPKMWVDDVGVEVSYDGEPKLFSGSDSAQSYPLLTQELELTKAENGIVGSYPCSAVSALEARHMFSLSPQQALKLVHGRGSRALVALYISNEVINVGTIVIPAGNHTDPESHRGDEVLCALSGNISVVVHGTDTSTKAVSVPRYEVRKGERVLVPEGFVHSYFNGSNEPIAALFAVAPQL